MFTRRYLFLNLLFASGITFRCCHGLDLKYRKQIYFNYVSLNKFKGEWIDPHSLGIFDDSLEYEEYSYSLSEEIRSTKEKETREGLEDSYSDGGEEIKSSKEKENRENLKNFSKQRMLLKNKLLGGISIGDIFVTEDNSFFAMGRNLITIASILSLVILILLRMFPKSLMFSFMLIVSMLWHWMKLYLEKIAEKQNVTENLRHPNECHRADLHWYEAIYLYLSSYVSSPTDCKEYYKAQFVDPFWEVSLPMAMMNAFSSTICEPMKVIATTIRYCFSVMFSGLTLLELSITLFSIFLFLLMYNGYSFSFCWGAIYLYRPRISADHTASPSFFSWGSIAKYLRALFISESKLICPLKLTIPPYRKEIRLSNNNKMKVSEKPHDEFQKQEKSTQNIPQNPILQSTYLCSEKNQMVVGLKISQFKKCHKKSRSF